jgi:hypothetical protein
MDLIINNDWPFVRAQERIRPDIGKLAECDGLPSLSHAAEINIA